MRFSRLAIALVLVIAAGVTGAHALTPLYLTARVGNTTADFAEGDGFSALINGDSEGLGIGLGLKLGKILVFQAEYQDFGDVAGVASCSGSAEACIALATPVETDTTAVSVSFLPHLEITDRWLVYAKVGFVSWSTNLAAIEATGQNLVDNLDDEDLLYGAGVRFLLPGPFAFFGEYESAADRFETISVGATFGF